MAEIDVRRQRINIDIESELREYDWGVNPRWSSDKLIASSPFRRDNAPSFYVNLNGDYAGVWGDSGAHEEQYSSGNFVALIAYLHGTDYDGAADYLLETYGTEYEGGEGQRLRIPTPRIVEKTQPRRLSDELIIQAVSPYIKTRGISDEVQCMYAVGYSESYKGHTAIPWFTPQGRLANVKYRSTRDKRFFYERDAAPIGTLVYGMNVISENEDDYAVLCEGEIDVMSWRTAGIPAIAIGSAHASSAQLDEIKRSRIGRLYLGGDNDMQGRNLNRQVAEELRGYAEMYEINYGDDKDANDVLLSRGVDGLVNITTDISDGNRLHFCKIVVK